MENLSPEELKKYIKLQQCRIKELEIEKEDLLKRHGSSRSESYNKEEFKSQNLEEFKSVDSQSENSSPIVEDKDQPSCKTLTLVIGAIVIMALAVFWTVYSL